VHGLITIRRGPGGGPSVGQVDAANLGRVSTLFYHLGGATYSELFEAWRVSEATLAGLAAANPDRPAVEAAMAVYSEPGPEEPEIELDDFVDLHTHFHVLVAELVDNRVLELMLPTSGLITTHHVVNNFDPRELRDRVEQDHAAVARATGAGHVGQARALMDDHIRGLIAYLEVRVGDQLEDLVEWR
jgi:GntR family transcriptional repressor for pyruvate dehydrogenase complex